MRVGAEHRHQQPVHAERHAGASRQASPQRRQQVRIDRRRACAAASRRLEVAVRSARAARRHRSARDSRWPAPAGRGTARSVRPPADRRRACAPAPPARPDSRIRRASGRSGNAGLQAMRQQQVEPVVAGQSRRDRCGHRRARAAAASIARGERIDAEPLAIQIAPGDAFAASRGGRPAPARR